MKLRNEETYMRILNRASVAFFIVNDYNKNAIINAEIKCNGSCVAYFNKRNGYYVFLNLEKGTYKFDITCKGFIPASYEVKVSDEQQEIIVAGLRYSSESEELYYTKKVVFNIKNNGKPVENESIRIRLENKVSFLRLIDPIEKNSNIVNINSEFDKRLLYQNYTYDKRQNMIFNLFEYDYENKVYKNSKTYKSNVAEDGYLHPFWNFKTDKFGRVTLPLNTIFFTQPQADLLVTVSKKKYTFTVNTEDTDYIEIDIGKEAEKNGV